MKVRKRDIYIFVTIFLLTMSHCVAFVGTKIESLFEYTGYLFLLGGVLLSYFRTNKKYRRKNTSKTVVILFPLMALGLFLQELTFGRKMTVFFTIAAIIIVSVMSEKFLSDYRKFRIMAFGCLTGVVVSTIASIILGVPIIRYTSEPTFGMIYYFNGGIRDKNVATMMIAIIMSLYIYNKERRNREPINSLVMVIAGIVIIFANSRGAWIELFVFLLMQNYRLIRKIAKKHRTLVLLFCILAVTPIVVIFYNTFVMKSETYLFRYRGLINYLNTFSNDSFHMIFGNAELAYGSGEDYARAVRRVTGWNGTIENAWLNILIKSGILGVISYIIIFGRAIFTAKKCRNMTYKTIYLSITVTLLVSSFVAIYIQTIHGLFGIYCYLLMAYYSGLIRENDYFKSNKLILKRGKNNVHT